MAVRSQVTAKPVEGGLLPGVIDAESVVAPPAVMGLGAAEPLPVGLVVAFKPEPRLKGAVGQAFFTAPARSVLMRTSQDLRIEGVSPHSGNV